MMGTPPTRAAYIRLASAQVRVRARVEARSKVLTLCYWPIPEFQRGHVCIIF